MGGFWERWRRPVPKTRPFARLELELLEGRELPAAGLREQYMLELINRMRENPAAELPLLLNSGDANIASALSYFGVNTSLLATQWASLTAAAPLAWNDSLASAALAHSQLMLTQQMQSHQLTGEASLSTRITNAGYPNWSSLAENIFAYADSVFYAHAAFAIDWGTGTGGIQSPAGHRDNIMSSSYREVGVGIVDAPSGSSMGPLLITQDFGNRFSFGNPFFLGVVYSDTDKDGYYSMGEGLAGVNLNIVGTGGTSGNFNITTSAAGGYQLQLAAGTYTVTASGGGLAAPIVQTVTIGSQNVHRNFVPAAVATPVLSPVATPTTDNTPTFTWSAVDSATTYDLWVDNRTTGQTQVIRQQSLTGLTFTQPTSLPSGTYRVFIRAANSLGQTSAWSAGQDFVIRAPAIPTITGPIGTTGNLTPTITWSASTDATRYDLWVNNVTTGQSQVIRQQNLATNSFTPSVSLGQGTYRAWVQAFNNLGETLGYSASIDFTLQDLSIPAIPTLTGPASSTTDNTPTLTWTASVNAVRYELWVSNLTTGQDPILRDSNVTTNSYTPTTALASGVYRFWVQAFSAGGSTLGWSAGRSFVIVPPASPNLTGPIGATTNKRPTFSWDASPDAVTYDLWVTNLTTGQSQALRQPTLTATSFTPTVDLPLGNYRFWVRAFNSLNEGGDWSAGRDFAITGPLAPTLTGPVTPFAANTPTLTWTSSVGATRYEIWLNNLTTGQSQVLHNANVLANSYTVLASLPAGTYRYWVQAFNAAGETGGWSASRDFQIVPPSIPVLTGPSATGQATPTFTWNASVGAVRYDLWVDNVTTGQSQVIRQQSLAVASFTPAQALTVGMRYRFWVRAFNNLNETLGWSTSMEFVVV